MASPRPTYTVILTFTDGTKNGVTEERTFTRVQENKILAWSDKKVWTDNPGLFWVQIFEED
jgi:hypothetical protein